MVKEELQEGHIYIIKHGGAKVRAKFVQLLEGGGDKFPDGRVMRRSYTHFKFMKLSTGREVVLNSTQKILYPYDPIQDEKPNPTIPTHKPRVRVSFLYDELTALWEVRVVGVQDPTEAKQAFNAVLLTCKMVQVGLNHQVSLVPGRNDLWNIIPAI